MPSTLFGSDTGILLVALAIALSLFALAGIFYFVLRRLAGGAADKTSTILDNLVFHALEWPVFLALVLAGGFFAVAYLPVEASLDFEIRRGFLVAFILLGAFAAAALVNAVLQWLKLEVTSKSNTVLDDWVILALKIASPALMVLLGALLSIDQFGVDTGILKGWLVEHGTRIGLVTILTAVIIFVADVAGSRAITAIVTQGAATQTKEEIQKRVDTLTRVLVTAGQVFVLTMAAFMILSEMGVNIAPVLAGAGVVGIAIGFGAQSMVKDLIAGFFVVMENQYRVGDVVKIADISGLVESINLRRTMLRDMDGVVHVVPNGEIKVASNYTKEWSRVNLDISVAYGTNLDQAIGVINKVCSDLAKEPRWSPLIIKAPQVLRVDKLGDSGIDIKILGDTKPIMQWDVMGELRKRIKEAFDKEGIEMPWPHMKVYFGDSPFGQPNGETPGAPQPVNPAGPRR